MDVAFQNFVAAGENVLIDVVEIERMGQWVRLVSCLKIEFVEDQLDPGTEYVPLAFEVATYFAGSVNH